MKFIIYQDKAGEWRWRLASRNGRTVADGGEGYRSEGNARRAVKAFRQVCYHASVVVEKVPKEGA